jgi:hypothetical protein
MLTWIEANKAAGLSKPASRMDCRVKLGNDEGESRSRGDLTELVGGVPS